MRRLTITAVGILLAGAGLTGCSGSDKPAPDPSTRTVGALPPGRGTLTLDQTAIPIAVLTCVEVGPQALSVTAQTEEKRPGTLALNLTNPVEASTMVYTTRKKDNSFTTYSVGSGQLKTGTITGNNVAAAGQAEKQKFSPTGKTKGKKKVQTVALDVTCSSVTQPTK